MKATTAGPICKAEATEPLAVPVLQFQYSATQLESPLVLPQLSMLLVKAVKLVLAAAVPLNT